MQLRQVCKLHFRQDLRSAEESIASNFCKHLIQKVYHMSGTGGLWTFILKQNIMQTRKLTPWPFAFWSRLSACRPATLQQAKTNSEFHGILGKSRSLLGKWKTRELNKIHLLVPMILDMFQPLPDSGAFPAHTRGFETTATPSAALVSKQKKHSKFPFPFIGHSWIRDVWDYLAAHWDAKSLSEETELEQYLLRLKEYQKNMTVNSVKRQELSQVGDIISAETTLWPCLCRMGSIFPLPAKATRCKTTVQTCCKHRSLSLFSWHLLVGPSTSLHNTSQVLGQPEEMRTEQH